MRLRPFAPAFAPPRCYVRAYVIMNIIGVFSMHLGGGLYLINLMLLCRLGLKIIHYYIENP